MTVAAKEVIESNAPAGAVLIAQAMDRHEGAGRYKAMQSIMDWDRSRLAYRAVKRTFDIVFSGAVLVVIAIPSLVLAALIRLESEGSLSVYPILPILRSFKSPNMSRAMRVNRTPMCSTI